MSIQAPIAGVSPSLVNARQEPETDALHTNDVLTNIAPSQRRHSTVSLVIPARNEARNLPYVLSRLPAGLDEVILVDGRSSDITKAIALDCRPDIRIITEPQAGKGHALRAGFEAAQGEIIIAMDADGSMSPEEIPRYVYFLERGFDFVKGSRFVGGGGSLDITMLRKLGNKALLAAANQLYGSRLTDLCYGFFGFRRQYLDHLDLRSTGFEIETELTIRAHVSGLRIAEIPSLELPRRTGNSNLHAVRDGLRVLQTLLEERHRKPLPTQPHVASWPEGRGVAWNVEVNAESESAAIHQVPDVLAAAE